MKELNFEQKLQEWADQTAGFYHNLAVSDPVYNLGFYTQSNLNKVSESPELLILGINPGSGGEYLVENELWKAWGVNGRMDGKTLLKGNPSFDDRNAWHLWRGLKRVFKHGGIADMLEDESQFAWSNVIFFNEPKSRNIRKELYQLCPEKTFELIKILKPKRIICLSIVKCFNVLNDKISGKESIIDGFLSKGSLLGYPIYGIRHTSMPNDGEEVVGKCLKYLFENEPQRVVSREEITAKFAGDIVKMKTKKKNPSKEKVQEIHDLCLKEFRTRWNPYTDINRERFEIANAKLSLTITTSEKGYMGIRFKEKDKKEDTAIQSAAIDILKTYGFHSGSNAHGHLIWLGRKDFKDFDGKSSEEISKNIISELDHVVSELEKISRY